MKEKSCEDRAKEEIDEIKRLKTASECSLACESREVKPLFSSMSTAPTGVVYMMKVSICHGGYNNRIQECSKYQGEIRKHEENARTLLGEPSSTSK